MTTRANGHQDIFQNIGGTWTPSMPDTTSVLTPVMSGSAQIGWKLVNGDDTTENYERYVE